MRPAEIIATLSGCRADAVGPTADEPFAELVLCSELGRMELSVAQRRARPSLAVLTLRDADGRIWQLRGDLIRCDGMFILGEDGDE